MLLVTYTRKYSVETLTGIKFITWTFVKHLEKGQFLFFLAFGASAHPPLTFFSNIRVYQVIPRLKDYFARNTTHYLFSEYFQSLRAKKIKTNGGVHFVSHRNLFQKP
jgi:hypothetical protein